jgi:LEA14-like dessication related protein
MTKMVMVNTLRFFGILSFLWLVGCSAFQPKMEQPDVKVTALRVLPTQGLALAIPIEVGLLISNPNATDLSLRGISYTIGIENFDVLSGVTNNLPVLTAYKETPVNIVVTANAIQLVKLMAHFNQKGIQDEVAYNFKAKLDFSAWLPAMNVEEKGSIPLVNKN